MPAPQPFAARKSLRPAPNRPIAAAGNVDNIYYYLGDKSYTSYWQPEPKKLIKSRMELNNIIYNIFLLMITNMNH